MQASSDLAKLYDSIRQRLIRMRLVSDNIKKNRNHFSGAFISHLVIETDNLVKSCLREFSVSSLLGARTRNGHRIRTNVKICTSEEAYAYILSILNTVKYNKMKNPKNITLREAHTIRNPLDIQKIFKSCNPTNISSINNVASSKLTRFLYFYTALNNK